MAYELGLFNKIPPTQHEERTGMLLTDANLVFLQNLRADYAQDLVNLELDVNNVTQYAVDKARANAQIEVITFIMEAHNIAMEAISSESPPQ